MAEESIEEIKMVPEEKCRRCVFDCVAIFEKSNINLNPRVILYAFFNRCDGCTTHMEGVKKFKPR